ncbi:MAG: T9SS type A sorting domain-containing protein [Flavobacteriales bacterium]|nr:T9SS type A sorting domain-containing protein [Flavobacteriales bacterium]
MKRFFTLSFLFFSVCLFGQNLIPDPSSEDVVECPSTLGNIFTFRRNPMNSREYIGVALNEPLIIGQDYFMSFYVSRAHKFNAFNLASNNIGVLFMTENFLNTEELGPTPNYSTFNRTDLITDTVNWVNVSYQFTADSAYQYLAFGNFFEDNMTDTLRIGGEPDGNVTSYYYFDDFCLSASPDECDFVNSTINLNHSAAKMWPNPCQKELNFKTEFPITQLDIYDIRGKLLKTTFANDEKEIQIGINLSSGIYMAVLQTKKGITKKRFMVSN